LLFWIIIAFLTAAAILAVLVPLSHAPAADDADARAARVYRDQLEELERDKADGRISASETEAARAEIARRLIAADSKARARSERRDGHGGVAVRRMTAALALLGIPILALSFYLGLGSPTLPGAPLAARLSAPIAPDDIETMIAKVEEHLVRQPEDGRGWDVIAPIFLRIGRLEEAEQAYRSAIRLLGPSATRQTGLGEAMVASEGGIVTAEAREAFEAAHALDSGAPAPRFYLALAAEQEGKTQAAANAWRSLLADTSTESPWRVPIEQALARVAPDATPTGPSEEEIAAASEMNAADREAMVESMVDRLATRLKDQPQDVEGWLRLIRSYVVLGRAEAAAEAARSALDGVAATDRPKVEALIADLGVKPAEVKTP
jgi:cytochrome c-type biogenesis protein CcmH